MTDRITVSVCMITYNHELFVKQAIEGVLMQKVNFPIELVIGEDSSTDSTQKICEDYAQKYRGIIKLLPSEKNLGMMPNFISTLQACTGKYIALCEGDDYWTDPYKLQQQVDFLELNPDYALCFHDVMILKDGELLDDYITRRVPEETDILELTKGNYLHTSSVVFKNGLFGNLPEQFLKAPVGDYFLHMLNARYGKIKKIRKVMAVYRTHPGSIHSNKPQSQKNDEWLTQLSLMIPCFEGEVKSGLINTLLHFAESVLINNENISMQRQNQIIRFIYEFRPDYLITVIKENAIIRSQLNLLRHPIKTLVIFVRQKLMKLS